LHRVLSPGCQGVIVNGWDLPPLTILQNFLIRAVHFFRRKPDSNPSANGLRKKGSLLSSRVPAPSGTHATTMKAIPPLPSGGEAGVEVRGTYVRKHTPGWLKKGVGAQIPIEIWCWRSISVQFMRTFIHPRLGGRFLLRLLYWLEERFPHFFGKYGQYPLIVIRKEGSRN
jgi:hypothetical protein